MQESKAMGLPLQRVKWSDLGRLWLYKQKAEIFLRKGPTMPRILRYPLMALVVALTACAAPQLPVYQISAPFNQAEADKLIQPGPNTIKGNAFMRQKGGGVVTCAGQTVYLVPATAYAKERFKALYGSSDRGVNRTVNYTFVPEPPGYSTAVRTTRCDSQGNFTHEKVADGEFYVMVTISWVVGYLTEGGHVMERVQVKGGETANIVLAP